MNSVTVNFIRSYDKNMQGKSLGHFKKRPYTYKQVFDIIHAWTLPSSELLKYTLGQVIFGLVHSNNLQTFPNIFSVRSGVKQF